MRLTGHTTAADTLIAIALASVLGCGGEPGGSQPAAANDAPLASRVGWVNGSCLAIADANIPPDTTIAIVSLDEDARPVVEARVAASTTSSELCAALLDDRRASNVNKGWTFYEVRSSRKIDFGIGVTGNAPRVDGRLDLTGDGAAETFTQCSTSEGISFAVWSGKPFAGTPLWSGYYYLGYDVEPTCPS